MEAYDWWRVGNVILTIVALVLLTKEIRPVFVRLSPRIQFMVMAIYISLIANGEASIENIIQNNHLGFRVPLTTAAALWVVIAMLFTKPEFQTRKHRRGQDT